MTGKTHALVGANAIWILVLSGQIDAYAPLLILVGAIGGILPDIDANRATIHYKMGGIFGIFKGVFRHRGFFHSWLVLVLLLSISTILFFRINPWISILLTAGYASHLFIDAFNRGMQFFWPYQKEFSFVPRRLWTKVGGVADQLFFICAALGVAAFLLPYIPTINQGLGHLPSTY